MTPTEDQHLLAEVVFGCKKMNEEARLKREIIISNLIAHNIETMKVAKDKDLLENKEEMEKFMNKSVKLMHDSLERMNEIASDLIDFLDVIVKKDHSLRKGG